MLDLVDEKHGQWTSINLLRLMMQDLAKLFFFQNKLAVSARNVSDTKKLVH